MEQQSNETSEINTVNNEEHLPPPETAGIVNENQANASENADENTKPKVFTERVAAFERQGTVINISTNSLCNIIGGGILSLPVAAYNGSILGTVIIFIIFCAMAAFCSFSLAYGCEVAQRFNYSEAMLYILTPTTALQEGKYIDVEQESKDESKLSIKIKKRRNALMIVVEFIIFMFNYGSLVVYSIVIADSIPPVLSDFLGAKGVWTERWLWLVIPSIFFFILGCVRTLHELKWSSFVGFATIFYVVLLVIARFFTNMSSPVTQDEGRHDIRWAEVRLSILATVSQFSFAAAYHYNVPSYYRELKDRRPKEFSKTLYIVFPIVFFCYAVTAILGYLTFGSVVNSDDAGGNIMNNYSDDDIPANVGRLGLFLHFISVYCIVMVAVRRSCHRFICLVIDTIQISKEKISPTESTNESNKEMTETTVTQDIIPVTEFPVTENTKPTTSTDNIESAPPPTTTHITTESVATENKESAMPPKTYFKPPPGDPSTTSRRSIVIEAFVLVVTASVIAAFVPGIGIVIDFIGTIFGYPLVYIFPALLGTRIFKGGITKVPPTGAKILYISSWFTVGLATLCMIWGIISFFMRI